MKFIPLIKKNRIETIFFSIYFVLVLIFSFFNPITGDGCYHLTVGKFIFENGKLPFDEPLGRIEAFWPPFLYHIILASFYGLDYFIGLNLLFIILPLCSLGILVYTYKIAKEEFNKKIALISTIILASLPIFIDYSSNYYIDIFLSFFVIGSVYYARMGKWILSGIFFGLSIFAKTNGLFILPCLLFLIYKKSKLNYKSYLQFCLSGLFGIVPYIREYLLFKNPVWPFMNSIFHGVSYNGSVSERVVQWNLSFSNMLISIMTQTFGIPSIDIPLDILNKIFEINFYLPLISCLIILFLIAILALGVGIYFTRDHRYYYLWIGGFIIYHIIYLFNVGDIYMRFLLPGFPVLAIWSAIGFQKICGKKFKILFRNLFICMIIFCVALIFIKLILANSLWQKYNSDFRFIQDNFNRSDLIYYNGQCLPIKTDMDSTPFLGKYVNDRSIIFFFNENFIVEPEASVNKSMQQKIVKQSGCKFVYANNFTGTKLCKLNSNYLDE